MRDWTTGPGPALLLASTWTWTATTAAEAEGADSVAIAPEAGTVADRTIVRIAACVTG